MKLIRGNHYQCATVLCWDTFPCRIKSSRPHWATSCRAAFFEVFFGIGLSITPRENGRSRTGSTQVSPRRSGAGTGFRFQGLVFEFGATRNMYVRVMYQQSSGLSRQWSPCSTQSQLIRRIATVCLIHKSSHDRPLGVNSALNQQRQRRLKDSLPNEYKTQLVCHDELLNRFLVLPGGVFKRVPTWHFDTLMALVRELIRWII